MESLHANDPSWLGSFQLLGRLGAGGMGVVYLGRASDGSLAAVKMVHAAFAGDQQFRVRFAREIATASTARAPWVARVLAAEADAPQPWMATEYLAGPTLSEAVRAGGGLPPSAVEVLAVRLAEALSGLHAGGMVHRDLKPSNVLLTPDGPYLIDFGIAQAVDATSITVTGMLVGSPGFMSPEQGRGEQVGTASDVFSLAGLLVFAATGRAPFGTASSPYVVLRKIFDEEPDLSGLPHHLGLLMRPCFAKDAAQRPSAADLVSWFAELPSAYERNAWPPAVVTSLTGSSPAPAATSAGGTAGAEQQYAEQQYAEQQYAEQQYAEQQYAEQQYASGQYADQQYDSGQYDSGQYASGQYASGQYGAAQPRRASRRNLWLTVITGVVIVVVGVLVGVGLQNFRAGTGPFAGSDGAEPDAAGATTGQTTAPNGQRAGNPPIAANLAAAMLAQSRRDRTGKFHYRIGAAGRPAATEIDGSVILEGTSVSLQTNEVSLGHPTSAILLPDRALYKPPPAAGLPPGKTWLDCTRGATSERTVSYCRIPGLRQDLADPAGLLSRLGTAVTVVGSARDTVSGTAATRYDLRIDWAAGATRQTDPATRDRFELNARASGTESVQLWVDAQYRPLRLTSAGTQETTYREWGQPVGITPPPAAEVTPS